MYKIKTKERERIIIVKKIIPAKDLNVSLDEYIALKVNELRKSQKINQQNLADFLNISRSSISNIESGRHTVTLRNLELLCQFFKCKSSDILPF